MQAYLIIIAIIVSALFLLVDLYVMAIYSHKDQPNTSFVNLFCKLLIILTLIQTQFQPFFLIVDVVNSRTSNENLTPFWLILYLSLVINLAVLKPIATSLYQRDHDDPCWKSTVWIIVQIFISVGVFGLFIGISWAFWGSISIPVDLVSIESPNYTEEISFTSFVESSASFSFNSTIICFIIAFFCILGYPILACCGACGLTVLPISLILDFMNRPTFRRTADARKVSQFLKVQTIRLLRQHERLTREAIRTEDAVGFFQKREVNRKFQSRLKQIESQVQLQKDYYQLFKMELQMEKVNPAWFWLKLILGILSIIFSILLWIQILLSQLVFPYQDGHPSTFLDQFFNFLESQNANFISVAFLMLICFYLTCAIIKGSVFFSNSIPFLVIHPIIPAKTWLNSFLFHLSLCSISATSLIHMLSQTFPYYLRGGNVVIILDELLRNMKFVGWFLSKKIFTYSFLGIGFLGIVFVSYKLLCQSQSKGQLLQRIEAKRQKLFGKQNKNRSLQYIEMVELNKEGEEKSSPTKKKTKKEKK